MFRILLAAPMLILSSAAFAQDVPADAQKDLWCGTAFGIVTAEMPPDATEPQRAELQKFAEGGTMLRDRAKTAHLASGYTEESFATHQTELNTSVTSEVSGAAQPKYTFEECAALLGITPPAPPAAEPAPAPAPTPAPAPADPAAPAPAAQ